MIGVKYFGAGGKNSGQSVLIEQNESVSFEARSSFLKPIFEIQDD